ncbi:MAG: hypothetical protein WCJ25_01840 [Candidatus Moraniibacteriota bacterium]
MADHKGNSGKGFIRKDFHDNRDPELTLKENGAWFAADPKSNTFLAGRDTYDGPKGSRPPVLQRELINFGWAAQWSAVLDYFAELLKKNAYKGKKPLLEKGPTAIAYLPEHGAFAKSVSDFFRCGLLQAVPKHDIANVIELFSFRTNVGKEERVLILYEMLSVSDFPEIDALIRSITKRKGKVIGIGCAVNDTFPLQYAFKRVPIVSVLAPEIERFKLGEQGSSDMNAEIIGDPYNPDAWEELIEPKKKKKKG